MLKKISKLTKDSNIAIISSSQLATQSFAFTETEKKYISEQIENSQKQIHINRFDYHIYLIIIESEKNEYQTLETIRVAANKLHSQINSLKLSILTVTGDCPKEYFLAFAEGLMLTNYQFLKYFSDSIKRKFSLNQINILSSNVSDADIDQLEYVIDAVYKCRDLVNETSNVLTSTLLAKEFKKMGKESGFDFKVFEKAKIEKLGMGGIMSINRGSAEPPTFSIMKWKPANAVNEKPIILVGKGVVYDTGGLSIKPTSGMDTMKADMAGAAAVGTTLYAIAKLKLPVYVIGLVPSTDNRVDATSIAPGDVVTMYNGSTVEILNTDAEGRMILADALSFADEYKPELVVDIATLTGAASRAVGKQASVIMGNAGDEVISQFKQAGFNVFERLVEFPFWDDYAEQLKSDIADQKNIGGESAGAITAGKFLEKFVKSPYIHLDIAGSAFLSQPDMYRGKGGTGFGVRLFVEFLQNYIKSQKAESI